MALVIGKPGAIEVTHISRMSPADADSGEPKRGSTGTNLKASQERLPMRKTMLMVGITVAIFTAMLAAMRGTPAAADTRTFELRTYTVAPGKFDALHTRFREHATKLFKKHGMTVVGFWVPQDKPDTLVYILAHPSRQAADAAWQAFRADPDWIAAKAASEKDGSLTTKIESVFMTPTDYSPIK